MSPRPRPARRSPAPSIPADKLPPHSVEAEQGALGCLLWPGLSAKAALEMAAQVPAHWFYELRHQTIARALLHVAQGGALDLILVRQHLKDTGQLEAVGGVAYLTTLADSTPSPANFPYYRDILADKHQRRRLQDFARRVATLGDDESLDIAELVADVRTALPKAAGVVEKQWLTLSRPSDCQKWTPPPDWCIAGDFHVTRGSMTILAGPPGCGKSRAINWLAHAGMMGRGEWFGLTVRAKFRTLILQAENGAHRLKMDWTGAPSELDDWVRVSLPPEYGFQFHNPEFVAALRRQLEEWTPDVIVLDPFNQIAMEDTVKDFSEALQRIKEAFAGLPKPPAIIIVHHFKKADGSEGQRGRSLMEKLAGSYKLGSAARCVLGMVHASDETEEDRIVWACAKNNDGELGAKSAWRRANGHFEAVTDFDWAAFESPPKERKTITEDMVKAVFFEQGQRVAVERKRAVAKLMEASGCEHSAAYNALSLSGRYRSRLAMQDGRMVWVQ